MKKQLLTAIALVGLFSIAQNAIARHGMGYGETYKLVVKSGVALTLGEMDLVANDNAPKICQSQRCELVPFGRVAQGAKTAEGEYTLENINLGTPQPSNYVGYVNPDKAIMPGEQVQGVFKK